MLLKREESASYWVSLDHMMEGANAAKIAKLQGARESRPLSINFSAHGLGRSTLRAHQFVTGKRSCQK